MKRKRGNSEAGGGSAKKAKGDQCWWCTKEETKAEPFQKLRIGAQPGPGMPKALVKVDSCCGCFVCISASYPKIGCVEARKKAGGSEEFKGECLGCIAIAQKKRKADFPDCTVGQRLQVGFRSEKPLMSMTSAEFKAWSKTRFRIRGRATQTSERAAARAGWDGHFAQETPGTSRCGGVGRRGWMGQGFRVERKPWPIHLSLWFRGPSGR